MVRICVGQECTSSVRWRSCGNIYYASEDFSSAANTWLFRVLYNDPQNDSDDVYSAFYEPVAPEERPMTVEDGIPIWAIREGLPLDSNTIEQMTCIPESSAHACAFVNMVLENLRALNAD